MVKRSKSKSTTDNRRKSAIQCWETCELTVRIRNRARKWQGAEKLSQKKNHKISFSTHIRNGIVCSTEEKPAQKLLSQLAKAVPQQNYMHTNTTAPTHIHAKTQVYVYIMQDVTVDDYWYYGHLVAKSIVYVRLFASLFASCLAYLGSAVIAKKNKITFTTLSFTHTESHTRSHARHCEIVECVLNSE